MSATNLSTLTEHIDEHELPWSAIHYGTSRLSVQLTSHSPGDLARWASTLGGVVWSVGDFRDEGAYRRPSWHVHAVADLDGDLEVWCSVPEDFGGTAEAVTERMKQAVVVLASVPDPVPAVSEQVLEGPAECFDRDCEDYYGADGEEITDKATCSHIHEVPAEEATPDA